MPPMKDLSNIRFGRLIVKKRDTSNNHKHVCWTCVCDCGNIISVYGYNLANGHTKSCGCINVDRMTDHGFLANGDMPKEYSIWRAMKGRCYNTNYNRYYDYGGRGIKVCDRWKNSFENFLEDMGPCPSGHSIERIDNNGDYAPNNCVWATVFDQSRNRRNNKYLYFNGERLILPDWAKRLGIPKETIRSRIKRGWSIKDALTKPILVDNRNKRAKGELQ